MRRLHLPRDFVVALFGGLANELSHPHELVPVDAAGTSLAAFSALSIAAELAFSAFIDHRSCPLVRSLQPCARRFPETTFWPRSIFWNNVLVAMESLLSFLLTLFIPVLELALSFSVVSADFTAKVLRLTTPQEIWRYRAAWILANRNVVRTAINQEQGAN
jgi:hypothetical protein